MPKKRINYCSPYLLYWCRLKRYLSIIFPSPWIGPERKHGYQLMMGAIKQCLGTLYAAWFLKSKINIYYMPMAILACRRDNPNPVLPFASWVGRMGLTCLPRIASCVHKENGVFYPCKIPSSTKLAQLRCLDIGLVLFVWLRTIPIVSHVNKHLKKKTWLNTWSVT